MERNWAPLYRAMGKNWEASERELKDSISSVFSLKNEFISGKCLIVDPIFSTESESLWNSNGNFDAEMSIIIPFIQKISMKKLVNLSISLYSWCWKTQKKTSSALAEELKWCKISLKAVFEDSSYKIWHALLKQP